MKNKFLIAALFVAFGVVALNAQPTVVLENPTKNVEFNTNTTPFGGQNNTNMQYNKFGQQSRNISVEAGSYDHYNRQRDYQHSILGNQNPSVINRPQSATLNSSPNNYNNQNSSRKISSNGNGVDVRYNTPVSVDQMNRRSLSQSSEEDAVEIGQVDEIKIGDKGQTETTLPSDPTMPISDAAPFVMLMAAVYMFIIRRK